MNVPDFDGAALCAQIDPDRWHPEPSENAHAVKRICMVCPVQAECLTWALNNNEQHGIWGGTSPLKRERMLRRVAA